MRGMVGLQEAVDEYRRQLEKGLIQQAYRGLMDYMSRLRAHLEARHPGFVVSGSLYFGFMDMTYFAFTSPALAERKLKVAVVYLHGEGRFAAWLAGANRQVQARFYEQMKRQDWYPYRLVAPGAGVDAILDHTLEACPDFNDLDGLTSRIEAGVLEFIREVERRI